jgi:hypothetical protein
MFFQSGFLDALYHSCTLCDQEKKKKKEKIGRRLVFILDMRLKRRV